MLFREKKRSHSTYDIKMKGPKRMDEHKIENIESRKIFDFAADNSLSTLKKTMEFYFVQ